MKYLCLDAEDVIARPAGAGVCLLLAPRARLMAKELKLPRSVVMIAELSDIGHARCIVAASRAVKQFEDTVASVLSPGIAIPLRQNVWLIANIVARLENTLGDGPWKVRAVAGKWLSAASIEEILPIILPRFFSQGTALNTTVSPPVWRRAYAYLLLNICVILGLQNKKSVAVHTSRLKLGADKILRELDVRIFTFSVTDGSWRDWLRLIRALQGGVLPLPAVAADHPQILDIVAKLRDFSCGVRQESFVAAWRVFEPQIWTNLQMAIGCLEFGGACSSRLNVSFASGYEANGWKTAALFDAVQPHKIARVVVNHNSHAGPKEGIANAAVEFLSSQRTANGLVDCAASWTPTIISVIERHPATVCTPFASDYPTHPLAESEFKILHAGNFQAWVDFFPFIAETSNEYIDGLVAFCTASQELKSTRTTVRVRRKKEVDADIVRRFIPLAANVEVVGTEREFSDQLAQSDLLVSFFSTTVEQALQAGKPVLLWGHTRRSQQFPARAKPPSASDRAPIYVAYDAAHLREMLPAIVSAHRGRPLSKDETAQFRWPPGTKSLKETLSTLLDPNHSSCNAARN